MPLCLCGVNVVAMGVNATSTSHHLSVTNRVVRMIAPGLDLLAKRVPIVSANTNGIGSVNQKAEASPYLCGVNVVAMAVSATSTSRHLSVTNRVVRTIAPGLDLLAKRVPIVSANTNGIGSV